LKDQDLSPVLEADAELFLEDISWQNYDHIQMFSPFGRTNDKPKFLARKLEICDLRAVGNGHKHLKMELMMFCQKENKSKKFNAIAFGFGQKEEILKKGQLIDVIFEMIVNQWNGHRGLEMKIVDLKLAQ